MNALNRFADPFYCLTRLIVGLMFASHGGQLVLGMFGGMPGSDNMMMQVGGWVQLVGGFMIAFGLFTRIAARSEEHTSELQSLTNLVCRLLLEKKKKNKR